MYLSQTESIPCELKTLLKELPVGSSSRISPLVPFLGPNGLMRCTGRLRNLSEVPFETRHPVILDGRHPFVRLLLTHIHWSNHHFGVEYLRSVVQEKFAVVRLRPVLRSIRSNCVVCRKHRANPPTPMMSDLPKERLGLGKRPFTYTSVDYFGPFYVVNHRLSCKRW